MRNADDLIRLYVYPILEEECKRLGIPRGFVLGVYACYCKEGIVGFVEKVPADGKVEGVRIRIGECNQSKKEILKTFFHEMYHVKEEWEGKRRRFSELRANLYAELRFLQIILSKLRPSTKGYALATHSYE